MRVETIFEMTSPYRDSFRIKGLRFGNGEKTLAIAGPMRGDEIQQQYICSQIVRRLTMAEQHGRISEGKSILVIPSCNPFSMNVSRRFWAMDNTDINRMFPGYSQGETTQRIAAAIFSALEGFEYGIQLASYYVPGDFVPHVRMITTGYETLDTAKLFGMKFVSLCKPRPFDTALLNYNWQIWNTKAFSVYAGCTSRIDSTAASETVDAIMRMMQAAKILTKTVTLSPAYEPAVVDESELLHVKASHAGIFYRLKSPGSSIESGDVLAQIIDPYNGQCLSEVKSPAEGIVFFAHNQPLVFENGLIFMIRGM